MISLSIGVQLPETYTRSKKEDAMVYWALNITNNINFSTSMPKGRFLKIIECEVYDYMSNSQIVLLGIILNQFIKAKDINALHLNKLSGLKGPLDYARCINMTKAIKLFCYWNLSLLHKYIIYSHINKPPREYIQVRSMWIYIRTQLFSK